MLSLIISDDLQRAARDAPSSPVVRDAVRNLALHALRSRSLTAGHIASVARAVGDGIESCTLTEMAAPVREFKRGAWEGLAQAVDQALYALELAARELEEEWAALSAGDREQVVRELEELERSLASGSAAERSLTEGFEARIATVIGLLRCTGPGQSAGSGAAAIADARLLSMIATGVLLGLTAAPRATLVS